MSLVDLEARRKLQYLNDRIEGISQTLDNIDRLLKSQQELASATAGATRDVMERVAAMQEAMEILTSGSHAVSDCITDMELRLQALEGNAPFHNPLDQPPLVIAYKEPEKKPIFQEPVATVEEWQGEDEGQWPRFRLGWTRFGIGESIPNMVGILVTLPDGSETTVVYDRNPDETL